MGVGDGILWWCKDELLCLLEQFVISSVPRESDVRGGMGNPDTVFCVLLLCSEIAAWFGGTGSSSEGSMRKKESRAFVETSVWIRHLRLVKRTTLFCE